MLVYRFGVFTLNVDNRRLLREGKSIPVTPKLFDILLLLVQKKGEMVTKEELMKKIWADQFVEDNNLTVNMSALRKILGESYGNRKYIETVPKGGYRFTGQVTEIHKPSIRSIKKRDSGAESATQVHREKVIRSLAVMPWINETGESSLNYLSDGITESIINSLSQLSNLRVLARNTVLHYKGQELDAQEIGFELDVEAMLIGRVLQFEDRLIVRTALIDATDGSHLWGQEYNHQSSDIFVVQEEIAREVCEELQLKLSSGEQKQNIL